MEESIPYPGAKAMYLVNEIDNSLLLREITEEDSIYKNKNLW